MMCLSEGFGGDEVVGSQVNRNRRKTIECRSERWTGYYAKLNESFEADAKCGKAYGGRLRAREWWRVDDELKRW